MTSLSYRHAMQRLAMTPELKHAIEELRRARLELERAVRDELVREPAVLPVDESALQGDDPSDD